MAAANSQQALSELQNAQAASQDPNTILANQRQQLGVDAAQQSVTGLRGAINNTTKMLQQVAPGVMGRTGNSLVTSAQANRIIQNEQAPISQNLENQGREYNQAGEDLNQLQQRAQEAASGLYQGQQDKLSYAQNLYNTLYKQEQDAQAARQAEADRQEQIRQFNENLALSKAAAARAGAGGNSFVLGGSASKPSAAPTAAASPSSQDLAYQSVQNFLKQGKAAAESDYQATLKSANYGNALDKLKVQLYNQQGIGVSKPSAPYVPAPGSSSSKVGIGGQALNFGF